MATQVAKPICFFCVLGGIGVLCVKRTLVNLGSLRIEYMPWRIYELVLAMRAYEGKRAIRRARRDLLGRVERVGATESYQLLLGSESRIVYESR